MTAAIIVLQNRKELKELGYSDIEVDEIATICMDHFISTSGVIDLNSKHNWSECFFRISSAIYAYNNDNKNCPISFNKEPLETDEYLSILATETLAIRLGDVSRDSGPNSESQSGEIVYVNRDSFNNNGDSIEVELKNAQITIGSTNTACTQAAIHDHARVLASAPKEKFYIELIFLEACVTFSKLSYEKFRNKCVAEFKNVCIIYPWDNITL